MDGIVLGCAAELEDDAAIRGEFAEQRFRQCGVVAAEEGGMGRRRIGLAVVVAGCRVEQDERRRAGRREALKRPGVLREGCELLQQHDIAERIASEPRDDLVPVPDRDHARSGRSLSRAAGGRR
ncbi:hypothetical protein [Bosea sp. UC22_33]|uniref:hypothetical protein n=1 Tax=Bosea sp. UC22_33 TaxID=3350165 RepID=UPI00366C90A6